MKALNELKVKYEICCKSMKYNLDLSHKLPDENDNPDIIIKYIAKFDEYGIPIYDGGSSMIIINYCPWCGKQLPESKRDLWFDTLERMNVDIDLAAEIPEEFKSSKWYETIKNRSKISTNLKKLKR